MTTSKLKELLKNYPEDSKIMCGFEGLTFYKLDEEGKHAYIGRIDFDNEKERTQKIFSEKEIINLPSSEREF